MWYPSDLQRARNEGRNTSCRFWNFAADGEHDLYTHAQGLHALLSLHLLSVHTCTIILHAMFILINHLAQLYNATALLSLF